MRQTQKPLLGDAQTRASEHDYEGQRAILGNQVGLLGALHIPARALRRRPADLFRIALARTSRAVKKASFSSDRDSGAAAAGAVVVELVAETPALVGVDEHTAGA